MTYSATERLFLLRSHERPRLAFLWPAIMTIQPTSPDADGLGRMGG